MMPRGWRRLQDRSHVSAVVREQILSFRGVVCSLRTNCHQEDDTRAGFDADGGFQAAVRLRSREQERRP